MMDKPVRAFETEHDIMGFEFVSGSLLFLKPSEKIERGQAVIFEKDAEGGCKSKADFPHSLRTKRPSVPRTDIRGTTRFELAKLGESRR